MEKATILIKVDIEFTKSVSVPANFNGHPDRWTPDESEPMEISDMTVKEVYSDYTRRGPQGTFLRLKEVKNQNEELMDSIRQVIEENDEFMNQLDQGAHDNYNSGVAEAKAEAIEDRIDYESGMY